MHRENVLVEAKDVSKVYHLGNTSVDALRGVTMQISRGAFAVIAGPSGSGKSTLLNILGCIDQPTTGSIHIAGENVATMDDKQLAAFRARRLGFIFQSFNLIPVLTAFENVEYPLRINGVSREEAARRTMEMLTAVGLSDHARHRPAELSGGQSQRVAIARALVTKPDLVLADEPTANLDSETGRKIIDLMRTMQKDSGTAFLLSTHDPMVVEQAEEVHRIHDGQLSHPA